MPIDAREFRDKIRTSLLDIADFVDTAEFQQLLVDLWETPPEERPEFVRNVILDEGEMEKRGIEVPEDIVVQRSAFGDNRPTLFCVTKKLGYGQRKVTVTFDNEPAPPGLEDFAARSSATIE